MKVDIFHYKKIINASKFFEFNNFVYSEISEEGIDSDYKKEEIDYLVSNDLRTKIIQSSKKTNLTEKMLVKKNFEQDFKLMEKYVNFFDRRVNTQL